MGVLRCAVKLTILVQGRADNSRWGQKDDVGRVACSAKGSWIGEYALWRGGGE